MVTTTSLEAYDKAKRNYFTRKAIIAALKRSRGLTRREIEEKTGLRINQVSGRVADLIESGMIQKTGRRKCRVSGNVVEQVSLAE